MKSLLMCLMLIVSMSDNLLAAEGNRHLNSASANSEYKCFVIAVREPWKESTINDGLQVKTRTFVVTIPTNVVLVGLGTAITVFRYEKTPDIVIGTEDENTFYLSNDNITLREALELIFIRTLKDHEISQKYNLETWNNFMLLKKFFLGKGGKAFIYEKGPLTVFFIPDAGEPFNNVAWAFHANNPNSALRIESNMGIEKFKDILFSIRTKEK